MPKYLLPGSLLMAVLDFESLFQEEFQGIPLTATKGRLVINHLHHLGFKCQFCRSNARILVSNLTIRLDNDLPLCVVSRCCNGLPLRMILRNHNCCYLTSRLEALSACLCESNSQTTHRKVHATRNEYKPFPL